MDDGAVERAVAARVLAGDGRSGDIAAAVGQPLEAVHAALYRLAGRGCVAVLPSLLQGEARFDVEVAIASERKLARAAGPAE